MRYSVVLTLMDGSLYSYTQEGESSGEVLDEIKDELEKKYVRIKGGSWTQLIFSEYIMSVRVEKQL